MESKQMDFLDDVFDFSFEEKYIPLEDISDNIPGPNPTPEFLQMTEKGIIHPIIVQPNGTGKLKVLDGRRRVKAARKHGFEEIKSYVIPADVPAGIALALILNHQRSQNIMSDLLAIEELLSQGIPVEEIARQTGIPVQTVHKRLKLQKLIPEMREKLAAGLISPGSAERASKLKPEEQQALAENKVVTGKMVDEARSVKAVELPAFLFETPGADTAPPPGASVTSTPNTPTLDVTPENPEANARMFAALELQRLADVVEFSGEIPEDYKGRFREELKKVASALLS
ncbi:MAG: ParB/RepB/Spo0J family partition protein [candidate division KSB1 bacterium]|nr:ParB/RepB/Spo0J family partition protein [candidate division KSB1 bacterium]